jgi:hypothetical protein
LVVGVFLSHKACIFMFPKNIGFEGQALHTPGCLMTSIALLPRPRRKQYRNLHEYS